MKDGDTFDHEAGEYTHTVTILKRDGGWGADIDGHPAYEVSGAKADEAADAAREYIDAGMPGRGTFA